MTLNENSKWSLAIRIQHWLASTLILALFGLGAWMRTLDYYHPWYQNAPDLHKSFGIILILIMLVRVCWRFTTDKPASLANHKAWEVKLAKLIHWVLYIGIFVILVSGYLMATSEDRTIEVFSLFNVPAFIAAFEEQEDIAGFIHEWASYILMALVALHIIGALKHHYLDKDQTLKRML